MAVLDATYNISPTSERRLRSQPEQAFYATKPATKRIWVSTGLSGIFWQARNRLGSARGGASSVIANI